VNLTNIVLAYLIPIGFLLVAWAGLPPARARFAAGSGLVMAGLATIVYAGCGFAFQFGGLGFVATQPGYESLRGVYSLLDSADGVWRIIGLRGFFLDGGTPTPEVAGLFLHQLPLVVTAVLIPCLALAGRARSLILVVITLLIAGLMYPLAGNWIMGGGWLANLGLLLQLGHGVVDYALAGPVYVLGSVTAVIGLLMFGVRPVARADSSGLPPAHFPMLAAAGSVLFAMGWMAWLTSNPLHFANPATLNLFLALANGLVAAAAAMVVAQVYAWFATGQLDLLMSARGWVAGWIIVSAGAPFIALWAALALGVLAGLLVPLGLFTIEHLLQREDATAAWAVPGLAGMIAVFVPGALANGQWGAGWNSVGVDEYLTVKLQGVTGLLAPPGFMGDPGQLTAQLVELASIVFLSMLVVTIVFSVLRGLLGGRS
jgi:Amt family ammonium transporter